MIVHSRQRPTPLRFASWALLAAFTCTSCGARTDAWIEPAAPDAGGPGVDVAAARNACGGIEPLAQRPDAPCGTCGLYVCDGPDRLRCDERGGLNACGRCGPTPDEECNGRDDNCDGVTDEGCAIRLGVLPTQERRVRVSGHRAILEAGGRFSNASDVVLVTIPDLRVEIVSPHATPIDAPGDPSQEREPDLDGDWATWITRRVDPLGSTGRIVAYDIHRARTILGPDREAAEPAVNSARVVFTVPGRLDGSNDVWLWDLASGDARAITGPDADERSPDLSGDWLVFTRGTGVSPLFNRQIVAMNLRTRETVIASEGLMGWNTQPAIDGSTIVWRREWGQQAPAFRGEIWSYDLSTRSRRMLSPGDTFQLPRVSGSRVCWTPVSGEPGGALVLDLSTGRSRSISPNGQQCDIDGVRLAWTAGIGTGDAYYRDLLAGEP